MKDERENLMIKKSNKNLMEILVMVLRMTIPWKPYSSICTWAPKFKSIVNSPRKKWMHF